MTISRCNCQLLVLAGILVLVVLGGCRRKHWPGPDVVDADAATEFTLSESGLRYKILRRGRGPHPISKSLVRVHYRGTLDNGKVFDETYTMGMSSFFILENVIPGWTEGLQYIGTGGMIDLEVPPELAYGERGSGTRIPPNATIHFRIELIHIE